MTTQEEVRSALESARDATNSSNESARCAELDAAQAYESARSAKEKEFAAEHAWGIAWRAIEKTIKDAIEQRFGPADYILAEPRGTGSDTPPAPNEHADWYVFTADATLEPQHPVFAQVACEYDYPIEKIDVCARVYVTMDLDALELRGVVDWYDEHGETMEENEYATLDEAMDEFKRRADLLGVSPRVRAEESTVRDLVSALGASIEGCEDCVVVDLEAYKRLARKVGLDPEDLI